MSKYLLTCHYHLAPGQYYGGADESSFPAYWSLDDFEFEADNDDAAKRETKKLLRRPPTDEMRGHRYTLSQVRVVLKPQPPPQPIEIDVPMEVSF